MPRTPVLLALAAVFAAAALTARAEERPLVICAEEVPVRFDPADGVARTAIPLGSAQIFDRLVGVGPDGLTTVPRLARWWDVSRDGLRYDFKLRRGVRFHARSDFRPTRPLSAADVVFSFRRLTEGGHPFAPAGPSYPRMLGLSGLVAAVEEVEDDLVRFTLTRPDNAFLSLLAMDFAAIQSAEYADALAESGAVGRFATHPVGTGPFRLEAAAEGRLELAAHPAHWDGAPASATLMIEAMSATERFAGLVERSCAVAVSPDPLDIDTLADEGVARIVRLPRTAVVYLAFNTARPPLAARATRRRLAVAIDREAVAASLTGEAIAAASLVAPGAEATAQPAIAPGTAGRADLDGVALSLLTATPAGSGTPDTLARVIAEAWATAGAAAAVETVPWEEYSDVLAEGGYDAAIVGFEPDTPDHALTLATLLGCAARGTTNIARWCDPGFDRLLNDAKLATDPARRAAALADAEGMIVREAPVLPLVRPTVSVAIASGVAGLDATRLARGDFRAARLAGGPE